MRRDAVVQIQPEPIPEPRPLGVGEGGHADEVVGPGEGGADDDQDDGHEVVFALERDARVAEIGEVVGQRSRGGGHGIAPGAWSVTLSDQARECARGVPREPRRWGAMSKTERKWTSRLKS